MIENVGKFKELINDCGINESQLQEIFKKYISFTMFDPVDWKRFEAWYSESNDTLRYCSNCDQEEKITVKVMRDMIKFIDSDEFKNLEFIDDGEYHEYIFEI